MFQIISFLIIFLSLIYLLQNIKFLIGLFLLKKGNYKKLYSISIIVPAKNEVHNISACIESLLRQNYPTQLYEIIVVNDHSTDATAKIVENYVKSKDKIKLINLTDEITFTSSKKQAIATAINQSQSDIILTIDADCIAHPDWLKDMIKYFEPNVGIVAGLVLFEREKEKTLFHKVQSLEFLSLVVAGFGSIGNKNPIIANGANLAYRRSVFQQVNGFEGIDKLKSGDDDLFIQKVAKLTSWKIKAAIHSSTFVTTKPVPNLKAFLNQRIRWASKGSHYQKTSLVFYLICVYLLYLLLFITLPLSLFIINKFPVPAFALLLKILSDFLLLLKGTKIARRMDLLLYFLLAEFFQIPYILYVGLAGFLGKFNWKDN